MDLQTQVEFAGVYSKLQNETHTAEDISEIIEIIRINKGDISDEAKILLLQIPLCVLNKHVEIEDESAWSEENGSYFAGNWKEQPLHGTFMSKSFDLSAIAESLQQIMSDTKLLNSDFHLRNAEVTLRDDVTIKPYSNFKESGNFFARQMDKAFNL